MVPAIASGHHGKLGCCGGLPAFGSLATPSVPAVGLDDGLGAAVEPVAVHVPAGGVMLFLCNVSAPFRARARPVRMLAPVFMVILDNAIRLPWN